MTEKPRDSPSRERRVRLLWIHPITIVRMVMGQYHTEYLEVPLPLDIPADTTCLGVYHDLPRDQFCLAIEHPSFDVVPFGEMAPTMDVRYRAVRLALRSFEDATHALNEGQNAREA